MLFPPVTAPLFFSSWRHSQGIFARGGVVVLMYHRIGNAPPSARSQALYVSPALFRRQMDDLLSAGWQCLTLDDVPRVALAGGRGFCITFDDGFRGVFTHALPILCALNLCATQFLVTDFLGDLSRWDAADGEPVEPMMSDADVQTWLEAGQSIGSHTRTHPRLSQLPASEIEREVIESRQRLEDRFGQPVRHFCYPYGDYDAGTRDLVAAAGYATACTTKFGVNGPDADAFTLRRVLARYQRPGLANLAARGWHKLKRQLQSDRKSAK